MVGKFQSYRIIILKFIVKKKIFEYQKWWNVWSCGTIQISEHRYKRKKDIVEPRAFSLLSECWMQILTV